MMHALHINQFPTVRLYKPDDSKHYAEFHQLDNGENLNIDEFKKFLKEHQVAIPDDKKELTQEEKEYQEGANFDINNGVQEETFYT